MSELAADVSVEELEAQFAEAPPPKPTSSKRPSRFRKVAMRPRRALVLVHRWLALVLVVWVIIVGATGAWLAGHDAIESWFDGDRYRATPATSARRPPPTPPWKSSRTARRRTA